MLIHENDWGGKRIEYDQGKIEKRIWGYSSFFIKFTKTKEYAQDIIDGNLHFSPIQNLRDIEKNGAKGQGDEYEVCSIKCSSKPATIILTKILGF